MRMGLVLADAVESPRCSGPLRDWLTSDSGSLAASLERFTGCPLRRRRAAIGLGLQ
jgi:hypothetical protein